MELRRKTRIGRVVSNKMDKTVVVAVETPRRHPLYKKVMKRAVNYQAHDEKNECGLGDVVKIMETRPISKQKRWRVIQIISKGEKYMNNAVQTLLAVRGQGKDVPAYITDHLTQALAKHAEVLINMIANTTDVTIKSGLTGSLDLVSTLQTQLPKLK